MNELDLKHLSELRALIEGFAARHAAAKSTDESLRELLKIILTRLCATVRRRDYAAFLRADSHLHETIVVASGVPHLPDIWASIWNGLKGFHHKAFEECFPDTRVLIEEHEHLVQSILLGDPVAAEDAARSHVEAVWFRLAEQHGEKTDDHIDPLKRATAHIAFRMHRTLRLNDIASTVAFTSASNLSRMFRHGYGMSFQKYVQKMRLEKAAELLRTTRLPIGTVAKRVGYRDASRFGEHFKRRFRTEPNLWRKKKPQV